MKISKISKQAIFKYAQKVYQLRKFECLMFFQVPTAHLVTPVPYLNKCCAWSIFLFKNIVFCIFTPKTRLVKENYFRTICHVTYLKDTS